MSNIMVQNSSAMPNPSQRWHTLTWLLMFSFLFTSFSLNPVSSSRTQYSYYDHCSSTVPGSSASSVRLANFPVARSYDGYYTGGDPVLDPDPYSYAWTFSNSVLLRTLAVYTTDVPGLFKFEGRLTFPSANKYNYAEEFSYGRQSSYSYSYSRPQRSSISFELQGYWSQSNGKLCMVGSASALTKGGNLVNIGAVLKLNTLTSSSNITSLITGTLENLSSAKGADNFDPVSIMLLPQMNYEYTSVSEDHKNGCSGGSEIPPGLSLSSLPKGTFCSIASRAINQFNLRYGRDCNPAKNCNPFDTGIGYVPRVMSLFGFECSEDKERMRVLVEFPNGTFVRYYRSFNPQTTLVGEGSWDESKHQLCIVACRFLGVTESLASARVGDCSTKLTLRFPSIWSIKDASSIVGQIWTNKTEKESGYFDRIMLRSSSSSSPSVVVADSKYNYTKIDTARKLCPMPEKPAKTQGERYPNGNSDLMRFDISAKNSKGVLIAWGYSVPLSVGDQNYEYSSSQGFVVPSSSSSGSVSISYNIGLTPYGRISPFNTSSVSYETFEILAEGTYHAETGSLCMLGCRNLASDNPIPSGDSLDCEILVKLHFPPVNSKKASYIKGSINSTRERSDPLYFERLDLSSASFYDDGSSIWRMDVEIIMVLISTTLSCVFVVLQIFHVKRHPDVLPFISLVMLSVLTLGHLIPLVLNFEALFFDYPRRRNRWFGSGGWVEANEVIVRVAGMIAFLFQFRLLQKTWLAKWGEGYKKGLWSAEKKTLFVALTLYVAGALVAVVGSWWNSNDDAGMRANSPTILKSSSLWGHLKSYAGLVLDGFLLPQILLNILWNSSQTTLSSSFYIGNTFVRLLPHAYDLYRAHNFARHYDGSYIYASPDADFYSTAWDVVIPLGCLLFAMIIYLQQRFGGRCFFPRRFRELSVYEAMPVVCDT